MRRIGTHTKRAFAVRQGALSGTAVVTAASAGPRAAYWWEYSLDGGKTWIEVPSTIQGKTTITGLPVAVSCQFRFRAVLKTGEGEWSQVIAFLVQ